MADAAGGTGFVVMPPLGAIIFLAMGRNPLAGMLCAYGAVSGHLLQIYSSPPWMW